jgi:excinuclease ABC subunit C
VKPSPGNEGAPFVEMVGLAKSRLLDTAAYGTRRVVGRRARRGSRDAAGEEAAPGSAALADAAAAAERGFVPELERSAERVFLPGRKDPVVLRQNSAELFLLARLRDEAHRFAITFHRKLRRERNFQSVLEEIPGVGEGRKKALLRHFGSLRAVREATVEQLAEVEGFADRQARTVHAFFHQAGAEGDAEVTGDGAPPVEPAGAGQATEAEIDAALEEEAAQDPAAR